MTDRSEFEGVTRRRRSSGIVAWLGRSRPTKPGETYGVPGQGDTLWLSVASIAFLLFVWWLVTAMGWVKPLFVPSPGAIMAKFVDVWQNGFTNTPFLEHVAISTARVFGAFLLACAVGIPLGLAMGMSPVLRGLFDPPIEFYRPIPPLAYLPLMIIWFGIGETSKVLLIFLSVFAPVALGARAGVRSAAIEQIHAAYSFGASRWLRRCMVSHDAADLVGDPEQAARVHGPPVALRLGTTTSPMRSVSISLLDPSAKRRLSSLISPAIDEASPN